MDNSINNPVRETKIALNRLGYYTPDPQTGMTDTVDQDFKDALYAYQRKVTVQFNDTAIGPGTTTQRLLDQDLARQEENGGFYIWHTVGDDHVRGDHALRNGKRFSWNDPPEGGNPGEDYNCRCWAEPLNEPHHPWKDWAREQVTRRRVEANLAPSRGLANVDPVLVQPGLDAINPTLSPLDFIGFGDMAAKASIRALTPLAQTGLDAAAEKIPSLAKYRDTGWIKNADIRQIQHAFDRHATDFGHTGVKNQHNLEAFKKTLDKHIKSSDTITIKGTYRRNQSATHYYNKKTNLNIMQNRDGQFWSGWKLSKKQIDDLLKNGNVQ